MIEVIDQNQVIEGCGCPLVWMGEDDGRVAMDEEDFAVVLALETLKRVGQNLAIAARKPD